MELWIHDLEKTRPQIQRSGWTRSEVWSHEQPQSNKQTESGTLGEGCCCVWCTEEHRQEQDEGQRGPGLQEQRRDARRASWLWTDSGLDVLDVMTSEDSRIRGHETKSIRGNAPRATGCPIVCMCVPRPAGLRGCTACTHTDAQRSNHRCIDEMHYPRCHRSRDPRDDETSQDDDIPRPPKTRVSRCTGCTHMRTWPGGPHYAQSAPRTIPRHGEQRRHAVCTR